MTDFNRGGGYLEAGCRRGWRPALGLRVHREIADAEKEVFRIP
jgi:hypothetical protein